MRIDAADNEPAAVKEGDHRVCEVEVGAVDADPDIAARAGDHAILDMRDGRAWHAGVAREIGGADLGWSERLQRWQARALVEHILQHGMKRHRHRISNPS